MKRLLLPFVAAGLIVGPQFAGAQAEHEGAHKQGPDSVTLGSSAGDGGGDEIGEIIR